MRMVCGGGMSMCVQKCKLVSTGDILDGLQVKAGAYIHLGDYIA